MPPRRSQVSWLVLLALAVAAALSLSLTVNHSSPTGIWLVARVFVASALATASIAILNGSRIQRAIDRLMRGRGSSQWPLRRGVVPQQLPLHKLPFKGRENELQDLEEEYDQQVRARGTGPVILVIEGMPGVGKTALALEFAHRMARTQKFPDGQLYASLGYVGGSRAPADVLQNFLMALGLSKGRIPEETSERVNVFRSITAGRRFIVVLDAAYGYEQISQLLPTGSHCLVIITTRWSLGYQPDMFRYPLAPPQTSDALRILTAFAGTGEGETATDAAEIVNHCGALPLVLRNVGEQIADGLHSIGSFAAQLNAAKDPDTLLSAFRYRGRDVGRRVRFEYQRLPDSERRALRLLAIVESPTFGPWVLVPLMKVTEEEAERLAARLASYHMLLDTGQAAELELPRYSIHPMVWMVARQLLVREVAADERSEAESRLHGAYLGAAYAAICPGEPGAHGFSPWSPPSAWRPHQAVWTRSVRDALHRWIRAEYCTLVRTVSFAHSQGAWHACWRLAALLGACVTNGLEPGETLAAFDAAAEAADKEPSRTGRIEVLLARGSFLVAVEQYSEAFDVLQQVLEAVDQSTSELAPEQVHRLRASVHRRKAEAWQQMGVHGKASQELRVALSAMRAVEGCQEIAQEAALVRAVIAENDSWTVKAKWLDRRPFDKVLADRPDDDVSFYAAIGLAEQLGRGKQWKAARAALDNIYEDNYGDVRRCASVRYRTARLLLRQGRLERNDGRRLEIGHEAVGQAGDAVRIFRTMNNPAGEIRAGALLARALLLAERQEEAAALGSKLEKELRHLDIVPLAHESLQARVSRCRGEVALKAGQNREAAELLSEAISHYERTGDWHAICDTRVTLATAQERDGYRELALASLKMAADDYEGHDDLAYGEARFRARKRWPRTFGRE
jgi:tetratricopeptide (TPR) repeat protein